jgi:thioester reductase-like protein
MPSLTADGAELFVRHIISSLTDITKHDVNADTNLFDLGVDSACVVTIVNAINNHFLKLGIPAALRSRTVYASPSVRALAATIHALSQYRDPTLVKDNDRSKMQSLYDLHTKNLPCLSKELRQTPQQQVVILTGSTGYLGSYILDALRRDIPHLSRIICLDAGPNSRQTLQRSLALKGLAKLPGNWWSWISFGQHQDGPSVSCYDADLSQSSFGLSQEDFDDLLSSATLIFHGTWSVNFNLPLDAYASHVTSVRRLVDFSARSMFGARIFFLSDWSAVSGHDDSVLEKIYEDWDMPLRNGYSQSKFVSERILDTAYRESGVPVTICRLGQAAGPSTSNGTWPKEDWFPTLIASSAHLHKIPDDLGRLDPTDWTPIDLLARVIVELSARPTKANTEETLVYHVTNPSVHDWRIQRSNVLAAFNTAKEKPQTVPLQVWLQSLRESASDPNVARNPALKLLDFFEEIAQVRVRVPYLEISRTVGLSVNMFNLEATSRMDMMKWMKAWDL